MAPMPINDRRLIKPVMLICFCVAKFLFYGVNILNLRLIGLELAINPPPPGENFVHYDFLKLHYIRHTIKDVSPLRVAALTCNITLYMLPPKIALNVPANVSTMTCSYIFVC